MKTNCIMLAAVLSVSLFFCPTFSMAQAGPTAKEVKTGISTLYARDPLAQFLCFRDGGYGGVFYENEVRNRCSDLNYNSYNPDAFTVGFEGGREGTIIDIGTSTELQRKYKYEETVGNGQGFASIQVKDGKIFILADRRAHTTQELERSDALLKGRPSKDNWAPVKLGSIYLLRITDRNEKSYQQIVKLVVIAHVPNESVTFRWQVL
ncbi:MAG: hypothetical protein IT173_02040 [Acidobacteria bacterium]|nr:hypothetical protein [Acidobacteriota bacterium]